MNDMDIEERYGNDTGASSYRRASIGEPAWK
jgi:hypothetical protein